MKYPTIRIEGPILASEVIDKLEQGELTGQKPGDFDIKDNSKVKDEIARAWADASSLWDIFKRKKEALEGDERQMGTSETRNFWIIPLLGVLGYDLSFSQRAEEVQGKSYAISHRDESRDGFPVHIMGFKDSLDKKRKDGGPRMSPHALVQEYLNLTEHLYALVTNGLQLRLLRDSSRLIKLSYLEFDLERMLEEEHYSDFAVLYRLIHATRMPVKQEATAESLIETYHQDSLESGSRIREGLSEAVELTILRLSNGFLQHPSNVELREQIKSGHVKEAEFYQWQLRLIYRLLFLMVIEERDLVYPKESDRKLRNYYYDYYSISRLRKLCEKRFLAEPRYSDYWDSMLNTFQLFEKEKFGKPLGIAPLAGELFGYSAIGTLNECKLNNKTVLECLRLLSVFKNKNTNQVMRVNYASLNVEEFGSVYEGLLEYDPLISQRDGKFYFEFKEGQGRSSSGSHYTPDELVQPLIKHSLDYIIQDKLREDDKEEALLSITVCDVACGSGHILLSAARRIATKLAITRTGEDQPSPSAFRQAIRDVIRNCIYGVDLNPLAVELCKVALWLEAHNPSEPLNFLDHHIKCGNAIVGLAHFKELENGIASEAFKALPGDDKDVAKEFKKRNDLERKVKNQLSTYDLGQVDGSLKGIRKEFDDFTKMPESTPEDIRAKSEAYTKLTSGSKWFRLKQLADIQIAQFFIPKTNKNKERLTTDSTFRTYLNQGTQILDRGESMAIAQKRRFFHWFLEFPEIFSQGGFSCILGNPPFLGGQKLSGEFGDSFTNYLKCAYQPAGIIDLVVYFLRRTYEIIKKSGFTSLIMTKAVSKGTATKGGLQVIIAELKGTINFAVPNTRWPGVANVEIAMLSIYKGDWGGRIVLDNEIVDGIDHQLGILGELGPPEKLISNVNLSFQGSIVSGKGFIIDDVGFNRMCEKDQRSSELIQPYLIGDDINSNPLCIASRRIINFGDKSMEEAKRFPYLFEHVERTVKSEREENLSKKEHLNSRDERILNDYWKYEAIRKTLYTAISKLEGCMVISRGGTKYVTFELVKPDMVFADTVVVVASSSYAKYAVLNSSFHKVWSWKYCMIKGGATLRYASTAAFETFVFPEESDLLSELGEILSKKRTQIMSNFSMGLTEIYNRFHSPSFLEDSDRNGEIAELIKELRQIHTQIDKEVLQCYEFGDIHLKHGFHPQEYLPENDRVRYTICQEARFEILQKLLERNHLVRSEEVSGNKRESKEHKKYKSKANVNSLEVRVSSRAPELFDKQSLIDKTAFPIKISVGSTIRLETLGKDSSWFSIGVQIEGAQKLSEDSALAKKLIGKKAGDFIDFGNGFKVLEVRNG